ncbi:MAG TPA: hypothetical protein DCL40_01335 [Coxiellaceae bacterium]|nr:hypothetical protein [Coxiellaceae bacterium]
MKKFLSTALIGTALIAGSMSVQAQSFPGGEGPGPKYMNAGTVQTMVMKMKRENGSKTGVAIYGKLNNNGVSFGNRNESGIGFGSGGRGVNIGKGDARNALKALGISSSKTDLSGAVMLVVSSKNGKTSFEAQCQRSVMLDMKGASCGKLVVAKKYKQAQQSLMGKVVKVELASDVNSGHSGPGGRR